MKSRIWVAMIACSLLSAPTTAQEGKPSTTESKTKLESFEAATGTVLIKGIHQIGTVQGSGTITVGCREFTDGSSGRKEYGILIDVKEGSRIERRNRTFVDYDEIESLIKGINYILKLDNSITQLEDFEAVYKTRGNLRITTFSSKVSQRIEAAVQCGTIGAADSFISIEQLGKFRDLLQSAKDKLDSIKKK